MNALRVLACVVALALVPRPACGSVYAEVGDAPPLAPGQTTRGIGALEKIHGALSDTMDVDVYAIFIANPAAFSATAVDGAGFDTQLFLFRGPLGAAVAHDDDTPPGGIFQSTLTPLVPPIPGLYYLAISEFNRDPVAPGGLLIWANDPVNTERAPDGPGGAGPWTGWTGSGDGDFGEYWITLTGCVSVDPSGTQSGVWNEASDAIDALPGEDTEGAGSLDLIFGALADTLDSDVYCIGITNPALFSATVSGGAPPGFDSHLSLFGAAGNGITFNDDNPEIMTALSKITGTYVPSSGNYYLAVSHFNRKPGDPLLQPMWLDQPFSTERSPDGAGAAGPFGGWVGAGDGPGDYAVALTGATFCNSTTGVDGVSSRDLGIDVFPNPFSRSLAIRYSLPRAGRVKLSIYDLRGGLTRTLLDEFQAGGGHALEWNGLNQRGAPVPAGAYFLRLESLSGAVVRKVILPR